MYAMIKFEHDLVVERSQAVSMGLPITEIPDSRIGLSRENVLTAVGDGHLKDECTETDGEWYCGNTKVYDWRMYQRVQFRDHVVISKGPHLVRLEDFSGSCQFPYVILESRSSSSEVSTTMFQTLSILERKLERLRDLSPEMLPAMASQFNDRCSVHIGGGLLASFNELTLATDACTDSIQEELNNGWRSIAVCVQPDQRRPDYVLARYNPQLDVAGAEHAGRVS